MRMVRSVLDDPGAIGRIDKSNMLSFCSEAAKHYENAAKLAEKLRISYRKPKKIVVAGMGGSGIGGELLKDWSKDTATVPIEVCKDYHLPAYVDEDTLVITTSYSGETEETLSVFLETFRKKCMMIAISSGGTLQSFAEKLDVPFLQVPKGMAPRATLPYLFMPLTVILHEIGVAPSIRDDLSETVKVLKKVSGENSPEVSAGDNPSKTLASGIFTTVPTIYGFEFYRAVAQRFKTQINENSKNPAKWEYLPELDHNEVVGWEKAREFAKCFSVVFIRDKEESAEIRKRILVSREIIQKTLDKIFEVWAQGQSRLARMSSVICVGDFTSVYLSLLRGVDPTPVVTIDFLKRRLSETGFREKTISELERLAKQSR